MAVQKSKLDLVVLLQAHGDGLALPAGFLHRQADGEAGHGQVHRLHGPHPADKVHTGLIQQAGLLRSGTRAVKIVQLRGLQPGRGIVAAHEPFGQGVLHFPGQLIAPGAEHAFAYRRRGCRLCLAGRGGSIRPGGNRLPDGPDPGEAQNQAADQSGQRPGPQGGAASAADRPGRIGPLLHRARGGLTGGRAAHLPLLGLGRVAGFQRGTAGRGALCGGAANRLGRLDRLARRALAACPGMVFPAFGGIGHRLVPPLAIFFY